MSEFSVGDRVKYIHDDLFNIAGLTGTVVVTHNVLTGYIGVAWDKCIGGHDLNGLCADGHGLWVSRINVRHIECSEGPLVQVSDADFIQFLLGE